MLELMRMDSMRDWREALSDYLDLGQTVGEAARARPEWTKPREMEHEPSNAQLQVNK